VEYQFCNPPTVIRGWPEEQREIRITLPLFGLAALIHSCPNGENQPGDACDHPDTTPIGVLFASIHASMSEILSAAHSHYCEIAPERTGQGLPRRPV